jgi:Spy/CpxP family protein refolding chaperone
MTARINPYLAALLMAGSLALALPAAQAQPMGRSDGAHAHQMRGDHGGPQGMRSLRRLDLTEAQREQVKKIFQEQAPAMRERMESARNAQQELRKAAISPNFDSGRARDLADTAAKAHADVALMRAETMSKVVALLTPEQRAKLEEASERGPRRGRR